MPYIHSSKREQLDSLIKDLHLILVNMETDDDKNNMEGNVNYVFTKILMEVYGTESSTNYSLINDAMGVLECAKQEFYRRVATPYEERKIIENGDIEVSNSGEVLETIVVSKVNSVNFLKNMKNVEVDQDDVGC